MKPKIIHLPVFCLFIFWSTYPLSAQEVDSTRYIIKMSDGNLLTGRILEQTTFHIQLETTNLGELKLPMEEIVSISTLESDGSFSQPIKFNDPLRIDGRYLYAPNGFGLRKGEGYYQNINLLGNQISLGITDHFTLGVGTIPPLAFFDRMPIWITPKVSIPLNKNRIQFGAGAIIGCFIPTPKPKPKPEFFGIIYSTISIGVPERNFSLGFGWGVQDSKLADSPIFNLGGQARVGVKTFLVSEVYISLLYEGLGVILIGGKTIWDKISLDYGLGIVITDTDKFPPIPLPYLGVGVPFGNADP